MKRPEQEIQRAVFANLRKRGMPDVFAFHPPNGGRRGKTEAAIFKGLGVVAGVPDVIAIQGGHVFALELKADQGRTTWRQEGTIQAMYRAGATVSVAYGLDEALSTLEDWGLLRKAAV